MEGNGKGRGGREKRGKAKKSRGTERKEREDIGLVPVVDPVGRVAVAILAFCRRNIPHVYCVISVFNVFFYCFCLLPLTTLVHLTVGSCSCFLVYNLFTSDKRGGKCVCPRLFVWVSVCLSVCKITQKTRAWFGWNVACRQMSGHGRTD